MWMWADTVSTSNAWTCRCGCSFLWILLCVVTQIEFSHWSLHFYICVVLYVLSLIFYLSYILILFCVLVFTHPSYLNLRKQKGEKITIWERNFQLALYSILLLCIVLVYEIQVAEVAVGAVVPQIFFKGWTINTVMISLIQAVRTCVRQVSSVVLWSVVVCAVQCNVARVVQRWIASYSAVQYRNSIIVCLSFVECLPLHILQCCYIWCAAMWRYKLKGIEPT